VLVKRGEVVLNRRGQYCLREQLPGLVIGTVQAQRNGDGWLLPDDASASIYLPPQQMREVIHGDRVAARIEGARFRASRRARSSRSWSVARRRSSAGCTSSRASPT